MLRHRTSARALVRGLGLTVLLAVGGCGLFGEKPRPVACPAYGMLRDGASFTRYSEGALPDPTNVELAAEITDVSASCMLEFDPPTIAMNLGLRVVATRGPAARGSEQRLAYIVAVTDADNTFLNRQVYPLAARFDGTARQAGFEEVLALNFPLADGQSADDFRVYVSLALRPAELDAPR